ncbi:hypothetical protein EBZ39_05520 [bacterium]|nr:hypothetical protein [bacterium]
MKIYGNASPSDLLNLARASKIPYEINKLKADVRRTNSGIKLDEARAKQIVEATRFIGPSFDLKRQQLALNVENVHNLMRVRKAGIALREDQIEKGASAMNQARRSITYLQSLAQKEYGKLLDAGDLTDEQEARKLELEDAIDQNQAIIDGLNEAQGLIPELDPSQVNQLFGGMLGEIPPIRGNIEGLGQPPGVQAPSGGMGALRGNLGDLAREAQSAAAVSRERGGGKGRNAVAPANPNVRVTAVRRGKGNK